MSTPVCIVRCGARTAVGLDLRSTSAAVAAGVGRVRAHPYFVDPTGLPYLTAHDGEIDARAPLEARLETLFIGAVADLLGPELDASEVRFVVVLPEAGRAHAAARRVLARVVDRLRLEVMMSVAGPAEGLAIVEWIVDHLVEAPGDKVALVAFDSRLDGELLDVLEADGRIQRAGARGGFHPGEAAGAVLFAHLRSVRQQDPPLARVLGWGRAVEPATVLSDGECLGRALTQAVRGAAGSTRFERLFADLDGERYREEEWGFAALGSQELFQGAAFVETVADAIGQVGAAIGPILLGHAVESLRHDYFGGHRAMVFAGSDAGLRAAVALDVARV